MKEKGRKDLKEKNKSLHLSGKDLMERRARSEGHTGKLDAL